MPEPLKIAVVGIGRMGVIHALHAQELARESGRCTLAALVDSDLERARSFAAQHSLDIPVFASVQQLAAANICHASVIVTPTENHREHAAALIAAGHRVLLEKPLTGSLEADRQFAAELDKAHPHALMLAFQRRFDAPLQYAKELVDNGAIGRVFKIYSALEDSNPAPNGYNSGGILPDMSVHNVDEILWLTGRTPRSALVIGARLYSHRLTTCQEDFDDALLYLWFDGEMVAQVQVTRNHVSGYRVETIIFGEEGQIHVGRFEQKPFDVVVEAYGRRGRAEAIAYRTFNMRNYQRPLPEFIDRFGPAYKAEARRLHRMLPLRIAIPNLSRRWAARTGSDLGGHAGDCIAGAGESHRRPMIARRHLVFAGVGVAFSACNRSRQKVIAVIPKATSHLFFVSVHAGVEQAARDLHVNVLWNGPTDETDYTRQIEIVDAMISRRVDALAISATDERALVAPLQRALKAGIPITVFDSAVNFDGYVSFIATDNYGAGCTAARKLSALIGDKGTVGMVMQKPGGVSTELRERGFADTIGKEFSAVRIVARQYGMADPARSRAAAENILAAHPDLGGIFASSEASSIGSILAIRSRKLSGKVKLVTFDFSDTHIEALADGTVDVMLVQDPFRMGYEAVKSLTEKLAGSTPARHQELLARVIVKSDLEKPDVRALLSPEWLKQK